MKISEILTPSFKSVSRQSSAISRQVLFNGLDSDFCRETVARGWLTEQQMAHAASRYCLGKSRSGKCIFWMIDELGILHDGHIGDSWASTMLKNREPHLLSYWHATHCLFGLHLLSEEGEKLVVAIVENEKSAVILSELFPDSLWLASVYPLNLCLHAFEPLRGREVVLFPSTDETMETYLFWMEQADQASHKYQLDITVSTILEDHATDEQKARHIDLLEYLLESNS